MKTDNLEKILIKSRYIIIIAVIVSMLSAISMFLISLKELAYFTTKIFTLETTELIIKLIVTIDTFLLGVVAFMVSFSLYELFIRDQTKPQKEKLPDALIVNSIDQLKEKISKVIILILLITFFKFALKINYETIYELLAFAISVFFLALALYFTKNHH